jgi:hypothetical protein
MSFADFINDLRFCFGRLWWLKLAVCIVLAMAGLYCIVNAFCEAVLEMAP